MRMRYYVASAILAGVVSASAPAQDQLLKQQEQLQAVAIQKVERSIREAIIEAQKLQAAGSNARAAERLRSAVRMLDDPILPKKSVDAWRTELAAGIRAAESGKKA